MVIHDRHAVGEPPPGGGDAIPARRVLPDEVAAFMKDGGRYEDAVHHLGLTTQEFDLWHRTGTAPHGWYDPHNDGLPQRYGPLWDALAGVVEQVAALWEGVRHGQITAARITAGYGAFRVRREPVLVPVELPFANINVFTHAMAVTFGARTEMTGQPIRVREDGAGPRVQATVMVQRFGRWPSAWRFLVDADAVGPWPTL